MPWAPSTTPATKSLGAGAVATARDSDGHGLGHRCSARRPIDWSSVISPPHVPHPSRPHKELLTAWLLLLLARGASYGYELRRELAVNGLVVDSSALYRALRKLESDGLVRSEWIQSETGPQRRQYHLTPTGRENLDEIAALIRDIRDVNDSFVRAHNTIARERGSSG